MVSACFLEANESGFNMDELPTCDVTGLPMTEGFCFGDGEWYCSREEDALKAVQEMGYTTLEEAYEDGVYYWSEWEVEP